MKPVLEKISLDEQSILAFRHEESDFGVPWHFHPQHELTLIERSVGTKFVGDYVGPYEPGELVLIRSNLPHCWKNFSNPNVSSVSTVVQWVRGSYANVPELSGVSKMIERAAHGIVYNRSEVSPFLPTILKMPDLSKEALYVQLLDVLLALSKCKGQLLSEVGFRDENSGIYSTRISRVHDYVNAHFGQKIYLRDVADLVNMSEQSFSRFFSKVMGRPFFTFLNEYRISVASRMLIDSDMSVAEVGFKCGYDSLPFFYKQFQKFKSTSPSQFRKKFKPTL